MVMFFLFFKRNFIGIFVPVISFNVFNYQMFLSDNHFYVTEFYNTYCLIMLASHAFVTACFVNRKTSQSLIEDLNQKNDLLFIIMVTLF